MALCIISPSEAQKIAAGDSEFTASLQREVCPDLKQVDPKILQKKFQGMVTSHPRAVAYLWRGKSVEAAEANRMPLLESCEGSTPLRCEALAASYRGELSKKVAEFEEKSLGVSVCNWREEEKNQDKAWLQYFEQSKTLLNGPSRTLEFIRDFPGYQEALKGPVSLSANDMRLLGTLVMISLFLHKLNLKGVENSNTMDFFCAKKYDCNIIITRVLDLLWQTGVKNLERVEIILLPGHTTLRVGLENGSFVFFNLGKEFLPANAFEQQFSQVMPAWQILGADFSDLGLTLVSKKDWDGAIVGLRTALKIHPQIVPAHFVLGLTFMQKGEGDRAIAEFRETLKIDPQHERAGHSLAEAFLSKGDFNKAILACQEALKIHPQDAIAHRDLGLALEGKWDLDGAIAEYRESIKINPHDAETHHSLGVVLKARGDLEGAIAEFRESIKINPKLPGNHIRLAWALFNKKDFSGAATVCRDRLKLDPQDALTHQLLGLVLDAQGDSEGAIIEFQEVLKIKPEDADAKKNLDILLKEKAQLKSKRSWGCSGTPW